MSLTPAFLPLLATISVTSLDKREVKLGAQIRLRSSQQCVSRSNAEGGTPLTLSACNGADRWDINDNPGAAEPIFLSASEDKVTWDGESTPDAWSVSENGEIYYKAELDGEEIKVCAEYFDQQLGQDQGYIRRYECSNKGNQQLEIISE